MDFSQTLPFSSLYCSQGYKQKSEMCCYFCLATKCEICQNLPVLAPIYGHFQSILVHFFAHGILRNYGKLTAENWPRDAQRIVVRFGPYQIKQYPLSTMVFASFLGVISNTDHRHFAFRTFPKLYPNFPELSRSSKPHFGSQSPGGKFHEALIHTSVANHQAESFTSSLSRFLPLY